MYYLGRLSLVHLLSKSLPECVSTMPPQLVTQGVSIVLRGQFNPVIFHPAWLSAQNLIREQEAEAAEIEIIHPQAAIFDMEWLRIRVTRDRFQAESIQEAYYEAVRDVVVGLLTILNQTPLNVMGINRQFHFSLESEEAWHAVGDRLAPKPDWEGLLVEPGMRSLLVQGQRQDDYQGNLLVKVEPSTKADFGVFVEVNDHYDLISEQEYADPDEAIAVLSEQWQESMDRSLEIATTIVRLGNLE